jgi:hypothetical protein
MNALLVPTLLLLQEAPAPPPPGAAEVRSTLRIDALFPATVDGRLRHEESSSEGTTSLSADLDESSPMLAAVLTLDAGPFDGMTHGLLRLDLARVGFQGDGAATGDGDWLRFEGTFLADWQSEEGTRAAAGASFGIHDVRLEIDDGTSRSSRTETLLSLGIHVQVEHPLGAGFRIGTELRASLIRTPGGGMFSFGGDEDTESSGTSIGLSVWLAWEPVPRLVARVGYGFWSSSVEWTESAYLSSDLTTDEIDLDLRGLQLSLEWEF